MDMTEAIEAMARQCAAAQPVAALLVYEGADGKLVRLAIPPSLSFTQGVIDRLYIELHPELFSD
jgi:hypothetical protein